MPPDPRPSVGPKSNVTMRLFIDTSCGKKNMSSASWMSRLPDSDERLAAKVGLATAIAVQQEQAPAPAAPPVVPCKGPVTAEAAESTASLKQQKEPVAPQVPAPARNDGEGSALPETEAAPKKKARIPYFQRW